MDSPKLFKTKFSSVCQKIGFGNNQQLHIKTGGAKGCVDLE
jgi:hypothetical protein